MAAISTEDKRSVRLWDALFAYRNRFGGKPDLDPDNRDFGNQAARLEEAVRVGVRLPGDSLKPQAGERKKRSLH